MTPDTVTADSTALLAVATFALVVATVRLVKGAEDTARKQLRAYIVVPDIVIEMNDARNGWKVSVHFENVGETPAYNIRHVTSIAVADTGTPMTFEHAQPQGPNSSYICGRNKTFKYANDVHLATGDIPAIAAGRKCIYVYGTLTYTDIFDKNWYTKFRAELSKKWQSGERLIISPEGNEAN